MTGGALFITTADASNNVTLEDCVFHNNSGSGHGAALYVADSVAIESNPAAYFTTVELTGVNFTNNSAGHSIVHIAGGPDNSTIIHAQHSSIYFINNTGTALHVYMSTLYFYGSVYFENNTADNGAALYLEQGTEVHFGHGILLIQFVNNIATQYGGAIYADLPCTYAVDGVMFHYVENLYVSFLNNKAFKVGN